MIWNVEFEATRADFGKAVIEGNIQIVSASLGSYATIPRLSTHYRFPVRNCSLLEKWVDFVGREAHLLLDLLRKSE